jgi:hypothetical protein
LVLDDLGRAFVMPLVDRFAQIERRPMTATEVFARGQDTALILGAIYGRLHTELVTPLLTQVYDLLRDEGMVPDLPLDGQIVQLVDRSPMSRAQSQLGLAPMTTFLDLVDRLGGDARIHIDPRAAIQFFADTLGISEAMFTPLRIHYN